MKRVTLYSTAITLLLALIACQSTGTFAIEPTPASSAEPTVRPTATAAASADIPTPADEATATVTNTTTPVPASTTEPTTVPSTTSPIASLTPPTTPAATLASPALIIGGVTFEAEIANTPALRHQGLSNRPSLPMRTGLLFIWEDGRASNFWMKDMRFDLDFVWIGDDCTVVDVTRNVPHPPSPNSPLHLYSSSQPAAFNFEINGGQAEALGLAIGDDVRFNGIDVPGAHC